jgi:hypothetical protein
MIVKFAFGGFLILLGMVEANRLGRVVSVVLVMVIGRLKILDNNN